MEDNVNRAICFVKDNIISIFIILLSVGLFLFTVDETIPVREHVVRKKVTCTVVAHLGFDDTYGYIRIVSKDKSYQDVEEVSKSDYFSYEDGKNYYFLKSDMGMDKGNKKYARVDRIIWIFFAGELVMMFISYFILLVNDFNGSLLKLSVFIPIFLILLDIMIFM